jgi:multidrug efflux pump subunit AcrB
MNPAGTTLKNNRTALVLYSVLMALGLQTFLTIGRLEYPEFTIRNAQIITYYSGRTTEQVEAEVTEPLEQAIRQMPEVYEINSTSKPGVSIISVEVDESFFELEDIWTDLRNKIDSVALPDGAKRPNVMDDFGDVFPYVYALKGDGYTDGELLDFAEEIRDELLALDGVAKVEFHGEQEERVYLEFSSSELAAHGATPGGVAKALSEQNAIASSGAINVGPERLNLVTKGEFESLDEISNYRIAAQDSADASSNASTIRISDIFTTRRGYVEPARSRSRFNGERVLCIAVSMIKGGVVTEIGESIESSLSKIERRLPVGLTIDTMFFQPKYVGKSIRDFLVNLGQAFIFVVIVMLLFAGWRLATIVGVLVPSAVLMCFAAMPALGVLLEMMSIAALIIALGLLVDNAVVVCEQILVRLNAGETRKDAVINAVKGLQIPLLAASGTTIAAFSTIALAPGATSEFTYSLFAVITLTLLASWILSLTIIPLLCYYFLKPLKRDTLVGRGLQKLYAPYESLLRTVLKWKWAYPALILFLTGAAGWGFRFVPNIFFPPNERGQFVIDFELPLGTGIEETENQVEQLENWLLKERADEVESVSSWVGNGGPRWHLSLSPEQANPNYALLSVLTTKEQPEDVRGLIDAVHDYAFQNLPAARATAKTLESGPAVGDPIQVKLFGKDMKTLYRLRDAIVAQIKEVPGTADVRDDWGAWVKQIEVDPDPVRSARLGMTTSSIAEALALQFDGITATRFREGDKSIPVVMRSRSDFRERPDRLPDLPVFAGTGSPLPLSQVAKTDIKFLPGSNLRENTLRVMTIKCRVRGRFASDALDEIKPRIDALLASDQWVPGYRIEYAGEQAESAEAQGKIGAALPISMSILALILISQFNSIRRFAIIALTIPPMLIGVVPGLLITGSSFGFMTLLGLIALMGIIVNNAILLIDETDSQLVAGLPLTDAVVEAAKSRLRPIVMTTITTIIGLMPLALGGGGMWSSMAYAMMFGLGFATLLTLLLCPSLFYLFFRRPEKITSDANK